MENPLFDSLVWGSLRLAPIRYCGDYCSLLLSVTFMYIRYCGDYCSLIAVALDCSVMFMYIRYCGDYCLLLLFRLFSVVHVH